MKTVSLNEKLFEQHLINTIILNEQYIKFIIESFKISSVSKCRNYALVDNKIFDIQNKIFLKESNLLSEATNWDDALLILETDKPKRSAATWWGNLAQNIVSVGSVVANVVFPGSGIAIELANGLVYLLRGYFSQNDPELQNTLYLNGAITIGFSLIGAGFGGGVSVGLRTIISSGKVAAPVVLKALVWLSSNIARLFFRFINWVLGGAPRWVLRQVAKLFPKLRPKQGAKGAVANAQVSENIANVLRDIQTRLTNYINKLVGKAAVTKLAGKKGFDTFFTTAAKGSVKIAPNTAAALLSKLGYVSGKTVKINGNKYTINSIASNGSVILVAKNSTLPRLSYPAGAFLERVFLTKTFKDYVALVFKNPSTYALAYKFLSGFGFSDNGNIESVDTANMPNIDIATQLSAEDLGGEVAGYEGESGQYTVNNQVTAVQTALDVLGKDLGSTGVDGKYGPITKAAINSAEADVNAKATAGAITVQTVVNIVSALVEAGKIAEAKTLAADAINDATIKGKVEKILNSSPTVAAVQSAAKVGAQFGAQSVEDTMSKSANMFSENYMKHFGLI